MNEENRSGAMTDAEIREVFLANGFKLNGVDASGNPDLRPYVYQAARALISRAQDAQVVHNAALEEAKDKWKIVDGDCREGTDGLLTYHVDAFNDGVQIGRALQSAPAQPVERPDAVEPHYVIRYVKHYNGPLGDEYAIISKADWDNGMSRGVAKEVCWKDGTPLIVIPYTIAANQPQQVRGNAQEPVAWTAAVEKAVQDAAYVFKDSCNHTAQAIDYMKAVLHEAAPQGAQEEGAREKPYLWFHEKSRTIHQTDMPFAFLKDCIPLYKGPQPDAQQSIEKDAERYRWLRHADLDALAAANWGDGEVYTGEAFDAAIDAALAKEKGR